jgi:hypothetical protein
MTNTSYPDIYDNIETGEVAIGGRIEGAKESLVTNTKYGNARVRTYTNVDNSEVISELYIGNVDGSASSRVAKGTTPNSQYVAHTIYEHDNFTPNNEIKSLYGVIPFINCDDNLPRLDNSLFYHKDIKKKSYNEGKFKLKASCKRYSDGIWACTISGSAQVSGISGLMASASIPLNTCLQISNATELCEGTASMLNTGEGEDTGAVTGSFARVLPTSNDLHVEVRFSNPVRESATANLYFSILVFVQNVN